VHRNPYLMLGVDYGTPPDQARRSFARAAKRVRRATASAITTEDLTWALHQIESHETDPFDLVTEFRVPADSEVYEPGGTGLFAPPARPLDRRTTTTEADLDAVRTGLANELSALLAAAAHTLVRFDNGYQTVDGAQL
jgi:hypothetical protein